MAPSSLELSGPGASRQLTAVLYAAEVCDAESGLVVPEDALAVLLGCANAGTNYRLPGGFVLFGVDRMFSSRFQVIVDISAAAAGDGVISALVGSGRKTSGQWCCGTAQVPGGSRKLIWTPVRYWLPLPW